jgi:hypothetical protein
MPDNNYLRTCLSSGKVNEYFLKLLDSLITADHSPEQLAQLAATKVQADDRLVDEDDEDNWRGDLPTRFSELRDEHFPLFVTFDKASYQNTCYDRLSSELMLRYL